MMMVIRWTSMDFYVMVTASEQERKVSEPWGFACCACVLSLPSLRGPCSALVTELIPLAARSGFHA